MQFKSKRGHPDGIPLKEDPRALAQLQGWTEDVYRDLEAVQANEMTHEEFRAKYAVTRAILDLDITGFTESAMREGQIASLLRIFDTQKVVVPVLEETGAQLILAFADDIVALYDEAHAALDAALEIHRRMEEFNRVTPRQRPPECCIGIGYGSVYAIGPNRAQGDEMNRAAKLGEDLARGGETLLTENAMVAVAGRDDVEFEEQTRDDQLFRFFRVVRAAD